MGVAALHLSCLATRNEARTRKGRDDAAGARSGALCDGMAVVLFAKVDSWPMIVVPPPWEGRGMGVVTLSLSCLATCEEGAPARAKG